MPELNGAALKRLREERQISLEQVAAATRIRLQILQDLEDEEYGELSSPTQARGFLKIYADYLGVSAADLAAEPSSQKEEPAAAQQAPEPEVFSAEASPEAQPAPEIPAPLEPDQPESGIGNQSAAANPLPASAGSLPSWPLAEEAGRKAKKTKPQKQSPREKLTPAASKLSAPAPSQLILSEIGRQLAARRNYLGIPWDLLVEQTHINKDQILALEQGDLDALSSPIQARGLLNTYARFLNLDSEMLLIRYADALQQRRLESQGARKPRRSARVLPQVLTTLKRYFTLDLFFGSLLVLGILGFLGWGMTRMITEQRAIDTTPTGALPAVIEVLMSTATPEPTLEEETTPEGTPQPAGFIPTPFYTPSSLEAGFEIVVFPRAYTWVRVVTDGELSFEGRLVPGSARAFAAEDTIELLTGDIATLRIVYNNTEIPNTVTEFGVSRRLRFDAEGIQELPPVLDREGTPIAPPPQATSTIPPLKH